jgi:hypothetical protein
MLRVDIASGRVAPIHPRDECTAAIVTDDSRIELMGSLRACSHSIAPGELRCGSNAL